MGDDSALGRFSTTSVALVGPEGEAASPDTSSSDTLPLAWSAARPRAGLLPRLGLVSGGCRGGGNGGWSGGESGGRAAGSNADSESGGKKLF